MDYNLVKLESLAPIEVAELDDSDLILVSVLESGSYVSHSMRIDEAFSSLDLRLTDATTLAASAQNFSSISKVLFLNQMRFETMLLMK